MAKNWPFAPLAIRLSSGSLRRVDHAATLTGDPLVLGFLLENCRALLNTKDKEEREHFIAQDIAMTGTAYRL